jgi:hypothetical protein
VQNEHLDRRRRVRPDLNAKVSEDLLIRVHKLGVAMRRSAGNSTADQVVSRSPLAVRREALRDGSTTLRKRREITLSGHCRRASERPEVE